MRNQVQGVGAMSPESAETLSTAQETTLFPSQDGRSSCGDAKSVALTKPE